MFTAAFILSARQASFGRHTNNQLIYRSLSGSKFLYLRHYNTFTWGFVHRSLLLSRIYLSEGSQKALNRYQTPQNLFSKGRSWKVE